MFDSNETAVLRDITIFYLEVKKLIMYAEESDDNRETITQIVTELRHSFDHIMRVFAFKLGVVNAEELGIKADDGRNYVNVNLDIR